MKRKNSTPRSKKKQEVVRKKTFMPPDNTVSNDKDIWKKYNKL